MILYFSWCLLMVDSYDVISGLWWSSGRYCSMDPPMQCTLVVDDWSLKETKIYANKYITPSEKRKSVTVFWLELSSRTRHLSSKPSYVSKLLSTKSTQQNRGITVIILKNSLPQKKTFLYRWKITVLTLAKELFKS